MDVPGISSVSNTTSSGLGLSGDVIAGALRLPVLREARSGLYDGLGRGDVRVAAGDGGADKE